MTWLVCFSGQPVFFSEFYWVESIVLAAFTWWTLNVGFEGSPPSNRWNRYLFESIRICYCGSIRSCLNMGIRRQWSRSTLNRMDSKVFYLAGFELKACSMESKLKYFSWIRSNQGKLVGVELDGYEVMLSNGCEQRSSDGFE